MGNCVVTKFKGNVNNDNLKVFDSIVLTFDWSGTYKKATIQSSNILMGGPGVKCVVKDNGSIVRNNSSVGSSYIMTDSSETIEIVPTDTSKTTTVIFTGLSKITNWNTLSMQSFIYSKYQDQLPYITIGWNGLFIPQYPNGDVDCSFLEEMPNPELFTGFRTGSNSSYILPDLKGLKKFTNLTTIQSDFKIKNGVRCELSDLSTLVNLTQLVTNNFEIQGGILYGNLSELSTLVNLTSLDIKYSKNIFGNISSCNNMTKLGYLNVRNSNIEGSIDTIANAQKSSRTNGSTIAITGNGLITYKANGDGTGEDTVIPNNTTKTITFDGAGGYTIA